MGLEERVTALEARLEMEAGLRAAADQDLASLTQNVRAQRHLIQAIAITQGEHTSAFESIHLKLSQIIQMLTGLADRQPPDQDR